jgi:CubicO group peptidase (beta-lactamase class C family)
VGPTPESINKLSSPLRSRLYGAIQTSLGHVFPALTLAIIYRGEWMLEAAWGWVDPDTRQHPTAPDTLFDLASVTKVFTAAAFLSLVSAGRISLHDPLVKVIPEFGESGPRSMDGGQDPHTRAMLPVPTEVRNQYADPAVVTFWHLLTHMSGLAPWRAVYLAAGPVPPPPDKPDYLSSEQRWANALPALCTYPFVGQPGSSVRYSDLGLMLLGEAVARLTGRTLDVAIAEHVTERLGLASLTYNPVRKGYSRSQIAPTEHDADWRGRRCWGEVHDENACGLGGVSGHAGLFGTVRDVALFGQMWLEDDDRLKIAPELMRSAKTEQAASDGERRGLGWMLKSADSPAGDLLSVSSFGHNGFTGTSLWIDPERQLVVACLTNRVYPGRHKEGIHGFQQTLHTILAEGLR